MTLEAYCVPPSARRGETVALHVSTDVGPFDIEVAREGAEREVVWSATEVRGEDHPPPEEASSSGCDWPATLDIPIGDWRSGYYAVTLTAG